MLNDLVLSRGCLICRVRVCVRVCVCLHVGISFVVVFHLRAVVSFSVRLHAVVESNG